MFPLRILVLLRRTPLGKVVNSVESIDSFLGKKFRSLGCPLLYWGRSWTDIWSGPGFTVTCWGLQSSLLGKRSCGPLIFSSQGGKLKLGNPGVVGEINPVVSPLERWHLRWGKSSRILEVDSAGERGSEIILLLGNHPMRRTLGRLVIAPSSECLWHCQKVWLYVTLCRGWRSMSQVTEMETCPWLLCTSLRDFLESWLDYPRCAG